MNIDHSLRSDKIIALLCAFFSEISSQFCQALVVWQELVHLENERDALLGKRKSNSPDLVDADLNVSIHEKQKECIDKACELKKLYNALCEKMSESPYIGTLAVIVARLEKDYGLEFKERGL